LLLLGLVGVSILACASQRPPNPHVPTAPDERTKLPAGHAEVIFVAFGYGLQQAFFIVDADDSGKFVGQVPKQSRLHIVVPAGKHTYVGWYHAAMGDWAHGSLVTGTLEAGRTYQVLLGGGAIPMQFLSMPMAVARCQFQEGVMATTRIGVDPSFSLEPFADKVEQQIADAWKKYETLRGQQKQLLWEFHTESGTYEEVWSEWRSLGGNPEAVCAKYAARAKPVDEDLWNRSLKQANWKIED